MKEKLLKKQKKDFNKSLVSYHVGANSQHRTDTKGITEVVAANTDQIVNMWYSGLRTSHALSHSNP